VRNPEYVSVGSGGEQKSCGRRVCVQGWAGSLLLFQPILLVPQKGFCAFDFQKVYMPNFTDLLLTRKQWMK